MQFLYCLPSLFPTTVLDWPLSILGTIFVEEIISGTMWSIICFVNDGYICFISISVVMTFSDWYWSEGVIRNLICCIEFLSSRYKIVAAGLLLSLEIFCSRYGGTAALDVIDCFFLNFTSTTFVCMTFSCIPWNNPYKQLGWSCLHLHFCAGNFLCKAFSTQFRHNWLCETISSIGVYSTLFKQSRVKVWLFTMLCSVLLFYILNSLSPFTLRQVYPFIATLGWCMLNFAIECLQFSNWHDYIAEWEGK